jgi:hypothetical protein
MEELTLLNYIEENNFNVYLANDNIQVFIINEDNKDYVTIYSIMNGEKCIDDIIKCDIIGNLEYTYFEDLNNIKEISNKVNLDNWYGKNGIEV